MLVGAASILITPSHIPWSVRAIVGWDAGALTMIAFAWAIIFRQDAKRTARRAGAEDPGRNFVWAIALASSGWSLFAGAVVLREIRTFPPDEAHLWTVVAVAAVVLSWVLTHTAYTLRYAHLYYRHGKVGGLEFPGGQPPSDMDFAYFSFTLGMCFQVSDVVVSSSRIRRAVLGHALMAFAYNTMILALALNLVFGLLG